MKFVASKSTIIDRALESQDRYLSRLLTRLIAHYFNKAWLYAGPFAKVSWQGVPVLKKPLDLWVYQEIIMETRPDFLIETGTFAGGSALYFASLFDLIGKGQVITVDVSGHACPELEGHSRIQLIEGDSTSGNVYDAVRGMIQGGTVMASLDSAHDTGHVLAEMKLYGDCVTMGHYMVVEDTGVRGNGPGKAVAAFLRDRHDFVQDRSREKFLATSCKGGYLKRVRI